jgi:serine/threonine-protein kinase
MGAGLALAALFGASWWARRGSAPVETTPSAARAPAEPQLAALAVPSRKVEVAIAPLDARVEVDGRPVVAASGVVAIDGALGSLHRVRVSSAGREIAQDVAITEAGPVPSAVRLEVAESEAARPAQRQSATSAEPRSQRAPSARTASADIPPTPSAAVRASTGPSAAPSARPSPFSTLNKNFE